jgi:hypothetical protein
MSHGFHYGSTARNAALPSHDVHVPSGVKADYEEEKKKKEKEKK